MRGAISMLRSATWVFVGIQLLGCATLLPSSVSLGERQSSYSYIPLDPLPAQMSPGKSCFIDDGNIDAGWQADILDALPDQAVRIAVGTYDSSGTLVYGPAKVGIKGKSYQIVLDYISVDAANIPLYIHRTDPGHTLNGEGETVSVFDDAYRYPTQYRVARDPASDSFLATSVEQKESPKGERVIIPVYIGVGLRLTANVTVQSGTANLSSLGAIAADAEAGRLTGSLVVQTLGVTGKSVATSLPLPSELNETTIQNAILALGSIKAVLYEQATRIQPRVVGVYNPIGGGQQVVNGIISVLASDPIVWKRSCKSLTEQELKQQALPRS